MKCLVATASYKTRIATSLNHVLALIGFSTLFTDGDVDFAKAETVVNRWLVQ